jgi:glycosyltransferase involved in cell wall biosynthesis
MGNDESPAHSEKLSLRWIELPILRSASAIHYTSRAEQLEASLVHPIASLPSAVIPLAIELSINRPSRQHSSQNFQRRLTGHVLFLSRLDRKKGLELLLEAFARVRACRQICFW